MRLSFDGLFGLVQSQIKQDAFSGALFLFRSRRGNFIKLLWWDLDGFAIFAKRLEVGTFQFPEIRFVGGAYQPVEIERGDLMMLLEGIEIDSARRQKRYRRQRLGQESTTEEVKFKSTVSCKSAPSSMTRGRA